MSAQEFSEDEVAAHWNANAGPWAQQVRDGRYIARERLNNPAFLRLLGVPRGRGGLDIGCGEGYNTRLLARAGARMVGVDISERMIALALEEEHRAPLGIRYLCTAYTRLEAFDVRQLRRGGVLHGADGRPRIRPRDRRSLPRAATGRDARLQHHPSVFHHPGPPGGFATSAGTRSRGWSRNYFTPAPWVGRWRFNDAAADAPKKPPRALRPDAVRVPQPTGRRRLPAHADRGAAPVGGVLPRAPEPARLAPARRALPPHPRSPSPRKTRRRACFRACDDGNSA